MAPLSKEFINRRATAVRAFRQTLEEWLTTDLNWTESRNCPLPLGGDLPVTPWRLAEEFLVEWLEWRQAVKCWSRFFGRNRVPQQWHDEMKRAESTSARLAGDEEFLHTLAGDLQLRSIDPAVALAPSTETALAGLTLLHELQLLKVWFAVVANGLPSPAAPLQAAVASAYSRQFAALERSLGGIRDALGEESWKNALWHDQQRRTATLRLGFLLPEIDRPPSEFALPMKPMGPDLKALSARLFSQTLAPDKQGEALLDALHRLISEVGYGRGRSELLSEDGHLRDDNGDPLPVNIIPGTGGGSCAPLLLALASGRSKTSVDGFYSVLRAVNDHLIDCHDKGTRTVIVVSDFWDSAEFAKDHAHTLSLWARRGIQFGFLLVGHPDTSLSALSVDL